MSINSIMPTILTTDMTWEMLLGDYVLKTIASGTGGTTSNASDTGSTTLTAAQSGVPAHSHGLNNHTHGAGSYSAVSNGAHNHFSTYQKKTQLLGFSLDGFTAPVYNQSGNNDSNSVTTTDGAHTHSISGTSGAATGNTANNSAANASQGHTHTAGMPANIGIYVWKRTA